MIKVRLDQNQLGRVRDRQRLLKERCPGVPVSMASALRNMIMAPEPLADAVREFLAAWDDYEERRRDKMVWLGPMELVEENAWGHSHRVKGLWDSDNGPLAQRPCRLCHALARVRRLL